MISLLGSLSTLTRPSGSAIWCTASSNKAAWDSHGLSSCSFAMDAICVSLQDEGGRDRKQSIGEGLSCGNERRFGRDSALRCQEDRSDFQEECGTINRWRLALAPREKTLQRLHPFVDPTW